MHELAFAATAAGHRVELRGLVHGPTFRSFVDATSVAPEVAAEPRDPEPDDVVILPEGIVESHTSSPSNPVSSAIRSSRPAKSATLRDSRSSFETIRPPAVPFSQERIALSSPGRRLQLLPDATSSSTPTSCHPRCWQS